MVGGDNASRGIAIGMVSGAYQGINAIPKEWKATLDQWDYCDNLLNQLPLLKTNPHSPNLRSDPPKAIS
jgi:hypothetical protein